MFCSSLICANVTKAKLSLLHNLRNHDRCLSTDVYLKLYYKLEKSSNHANDAVACLNFVLHHLLVIDLFLMSKCKGSITLHYPVNIVYL